MRLCWWSLRCSPSYGLVIPTAGDLVTGSYRISLLFGLSWCLLLAKKFVVVRNVEEIVYGVELKLIL